MIRSIILCALFLGVANAARQIVVNPSPPPPGPTTADVPGALVSIVAPGSSSATWSAAQSSALCAGLVANYTSLYPKQHIQCEVKGTVDTTVHAAAAVQTWLWWAQFAGMTDADKQSATDSRNLFVNTLAANANDIQVLGKSTNVNDTCNSAWVSSDNPQTSFSTVYKNIPNMPAVECRIGINGATAEAYNSPSAGQCAGTTMNQALCFTSATANTVGQYGIDNGKTCPLGLGAVTQATAPTQLTLYSSTNGAAIAEATNGNGFTQSNSGTVVTLRITTTATLVSAGSLLSSTNAVVGAQSFVTFGGLTTGGITGGAGTGCTAANVVNYLQTVPIQVSAFAQGDISFTTDLAAIGCTTAPTIGATVFTAGGPNASQPGATLAPVWSPYCDTTDTFYQAYGVGLPNAVTGFTVCPRCGGTTAGTNQRFTYTAAGNNAGKACRSGGYPLAQGVVGNPSSVQAAGFAGTSCIGVGVANVGVSSVDNRKAMLPSTSPVPYPYVTNQYAFPSANTACGSATNCAPTGNFGPSSVVPYQSGFIDGSTSVTKFQQMAIDSEFGVPCSTPVLSPPIGGSLITPAAIAGGYYLNAAIAARGSGTCNTNSRWTNGGLGARPAGNGIAFATSTMADLPTTFLANIEGPTAPPKPTPPTPAPAGPKPTPPKPIVCTYKGSYEIVPLYGPCDKYHLASGTADDCSYNLVTLRTKSQLGKKMARIRWGFATVAEAGLSTPTNVVAEARISAKGTCTNRFLAAPSDPKTLKVGGSSWKWQFVPYPDSDKCDHVNMISQNRLATTAFLEVPRTCDRFRWNATDGGRQRFRLKKIQ